MRLNFIITIIMVFSTMVFQGQTVKSEECIGKGSWHDFITTCTTSPSYAGKQIEILETTNGCVSVELERSGRFSIVKLTSYDDSLKLVDSKLTKIRELHNIHLTYDFKFSKSLVYNGYIFIFVTEQRISQFTYAYSEKTLKCFKFSLESLELVEINNEVFVQNNKVEKKYNAPDADASVIAGYFIILLGEEGIVITSVRQRHAYTKLSLNSVINITIDNFILDQNINIIDTFSFEREYSTEFEIIDALIHGEKLYLLERRTLADLRYENELFIHVINVSSKKLEESLQVEFFQDVFANEARLFRTESGRLICAGAFGEMASRNTVGTFYMEISSMNTLSKMEFYKFSSDDILRSLGKQNPKLEKGLNDGKDYYLPHVLISQIVELESKKLVLVCQVRQFGVTGLNNRRLFRATMMHVSSTQNYTSSSVGLAIMNVCFKNGRVEWCSIIPRNIYLAEPFKTVYTINKGDSFDLIYNDHQSNEKGYKELLRTKKRRDLMLVNVSDDGELSHRNFDQEEANQGMFSSSIDPSSEKSKYFFLFDGKCERIIRLN